MLPGDSNAQGYPWRLGGGREGGGDRQSALVGGHDSLDAQGRSGARDPHLLADTRTEPVDGGLVLDCTIGDSESVGSAGAAAVRTGGATFATRSGAAGTTAGCGVPGTEGAATRS